MPGRLPEFHVPGLRLLQRRGANPSRPARRRRIRGPRAGQPERGVAGRTAVRSDDPGRKNVRFANKRINVGVDIYNLFNNDAIRGYENDLDQTDNPNTPVVEQWGQASTLLSPRFVRLSIQFDF